jgi:hypothetical protein
MRTHIRLKLDMAGRAAEFCRAHPDDNASSKQVADRLTELVARADTLAREQRGGVVAASAAVDQKSQLRGAIREHLASLVGIARAAAKEHPDITVHRRMPPARGNEVTFLTTARVAVAEAEALKETLAPFGLGDELLTTLNQELDAYQAALARQRTGVTTQVGAGAELANVTAAIMSVVKNLDAIHRIRFTGDQERLAAWYSARNVAWRTLPSAAATPAPAPTPAPSGDLPKAA